MNFSKTKKCARQGCEGTIELVGRHCSRGYGHFHSRDELCAACKEAYCGLCLAEGCARCDKGKLTDRRLAQNAALKKRSEHDRACATCSAPPTQVAWEKYSIYVDGIENVGDGSRRVFGPRSFCSTGERIHEELKALGADIDESGGQSGWDGCDWSGEPLARLQPGYREVVTWRRECDEKERRRLAEEWHKHG